MKRLISIFLIIIAMANAARAGGKTEFSVGYGGLPAMRFIPGYYNHWNKMNPWGAVVISLEHEFFPDLWLGFSYTISSASSNDVSNMRGGAIVWHSMMATARYGYFTRGRVMLYASAGVGSLSAFIQPDWAENYNRTMIGFQINPVGVALRLLDNLDIFGEAGFGVQGIARSGLRIDF
ncbi:MAG: hypothetical protein K2F71_03875 [Paramuribaculum sp.]|nr:hypothetical protein [Paramuribaculum sp.]